MLRAAIVGIGTWGQNLVKSVQGSERIRFVAGATGTPSKAEEFSRLHGLSLFRRYEDLLNEKDIEAVVLATPHSLHCEQIVAAANAGKHVFVEKPLGLDRQEAERAVAACGGGGGGLPGGYNWGFQPGRAEIKARLGAGGPANPVHIEG